MLLAAIFLVLAYIIISSVLGMLWGAWGGVRSHHHGHRHVGASRHRSIKPEKTHNTIHDTVGVAVEEYAEDADTLLGMVGHPTPPAVHHGGGDGNSGDQFSHSGTPTGGGHVTSNAGSTQRGIAHRALDEDDDLVGLASRHHGAAATSNDDDDSGGPLWTGGHAQPADRLLAGDIDEDSGGGGSGQEGEGVGGRRKGYGMYGDVHDTADMLDSV